MKQVNRRMTKQKRLILEILRSTKSHPTADWIYDQARKVLPGISLGTIYRNLAILKEDGEIMELNYGSTYSRYDGNPQNHYHFVCLKCGRVEDVDMPVCGELDKQAEKTKIGQVYYHRLEFYGLCLHCQSNREEKPQKNGG